MSKNIFEDTQKNIESRPILIQSGHLWCLGSILRSAFDGHKGRQDVKGNPPD